MPRGKKTLRSVVSSPLAPSIPAAPVTVAPAAHNQPSLLNTMKEGFAFGAGSEMGHSLFRMILGSGRSSASVSEKTEYTKCLDKGSEPRLCKELYGDLDSV